MQSLKRPEMIISVATATSLIGTIVYFYRRENSLQDDINALRDDLSVTLKKFNEINRNEEVFGQQYNQMVNAVQKCVAIANNATRNVASFQALLDNLQETLDEIKSNQDAIISSLQDNNIHVDLSGEAFAAVQQTQPQKKRVSIKVPTPAPKRTQPAQVQVQTRAAPKQAKKVPPTPVSVPVQAPVPVDVEDPNDDLVETPPPPQPKSKPAPKAKQPVPVQPDPLDIDGDDEVFDIEDAADLEDPQNDGDDLDLAAHVQAVRSQKKRQTAVSSA
jgi:hypothetical protein